MKSYVSQGCSVETIEAVHMVPVVHKVPSHFQVFRLLDRHSGRH